jgi:hypothetical protein
MLDLTDNVEYVVYALDPPAGQDLQKNTEKTNFVKMV